jgi:hypothetical protein
VPNFVPTSCMEALADRSDQRSRETIRSRKLLDRRGSQRSNPSTFRPRATRNLGTAGELDACAKTTMCLPANRKPVMLIRAEKR